MRVFAFFTLLLLSIPAALSAQEAAPISVVSSGQALTGDSPIDLQLTNLTSKKIVGYVLLFVPRDGPSTSAQRTVETRITGLEPPPARESFAPGEVWRHRTGFKGSKLTESRIVVDYVIFSDRSTWGPNSAGKAERMKGIEEGWHASLLQLKALLDEKGPAGVAEMLNRVSH